MFQSSNRLGVAPRRQLLPVETHVPVEGKRHSSWSAATPHRQRVPSLWGWGRGGAPPSASARCSCCSDKLHRSMIPTTDLSSCGPLRPSCGWLWWVMGGGLQIVALGCLLDSSHILFLSLPLSLPLFLPFFLSLHTKMSGCSSSLSLSLPLFSLPPQRNSSFSDLPDQPLLLFSSNALISLFSSSQPLLLLLLSSALEAPELQAFASAAAVLAERSSSLRLSGGGGDRYEFLHS